MSGLEINLHKCEQIQVGREDRGESFARILGCKLGKLPTKYLGLPLGATYKVKAMWDVVEEKLRRKLAAWKKQYLSKEGVTFQFTYQ